MMLGFKQMFFQYVEEGSKTHTLRDEREDRPIVPGDRLDCYVNPRQKTMRLLGRWPCTEVQDAIIGRTGITRIPLKLTIDNLVLAPDEAENFFWRDGFRNNPHIPWVNALWIKCGGGLLGSFTSMKMAASFWRGKPDPWNGVLIHWDYNRPTPKGKLET